MNLPTDPRLPIIYDENIKPLTQRLYELFRDVFTSIKEVDNYINPIRLMSSFVNASENYFFDGSTANQLKLKKGTPEAPGIDVMTVDAAGKVEFPQNAQTWQNVTASRVAATPYTNSTGQPITVLFTTSLSSGWSSTATVAEVAIGKCGGNNTYGSMSFVVPIGATYSIDVLHTTPQWMELR